MKSSVGAFLTGFLLLASAGSAQAQDTWRYTLSLPDITVQCATQGLGNSTSCFSESDSSFTQYEFDYSGTFDYLNVGDTNCPGGCTSSNTVNASYTFGSFSYFTDSTNHEAGVSIRFNDGSNYLAFSFEEPDSFWKTPGTAVTLPNNGSTEISIWGPGFQGAGQSLNTPAGNQCNECTVTIEDASAAPEPGSSFLLAGALAAGVVFFRRRRHA